jgi:hypothetical protein
MGAASWKTRVREARRKRRSRRATLKRDEIAPSHRLSPVGRGPHPTTSRHAKMLCITAKTGRPCLRWSGRIVARTGLRMMPTFPRSPLTFRKASFPRYG